MMIQVSFVIFSFYCIIIYNISYYQINFIKDYLASKGFPNFFTDCLLNGCCVPGIILEVGVQGICEEVATGKLILSHQLNEGTGGTTLIQHHERQRSHRGKVHGVDNVSPKTLKTSWGEPGERMEGQGWGEGKTFQQREQHVQSSWVKAWHVQKPQS